nr:HAD-IA family hydrolase [uncultured Niameybacter sp.]
MYNIYLLDFDYTLADSHRGIVMCFRHVLNTHGIENISDEAIKKTIGLTLMDAFRVLTGSEDKELLTRYKEEYMVKADEVMTKNTILYKETIPMFKRLKRAGHKVGIISTKLRYRIEQTLEAYELEGFVDLIIGGEDVEEAKPNPQGIYKAIEYFNGLKEEVLYVGDSYIDAEAARNAGVAFMGVTTGTTTKEDFLAYPHIKIMDTLDEVASIHNKKV